MAGGVGEGIVAVVEAGAHRVAAAGVHRAEVVCGEVAGAHRVVHRAEAVSGAGDKAGNRVGSKEEEVILVPSSSVPAQVPFVLQRPAFNRAA